MIQLNDSKANNKPTNRYYFSSVKIDVAIAMKILDFDSQIQQFKSRFLFRYYFFSDSVAFA